MTQPTGVVLNDLHKTFRSPAGPVPAVAGVDLTVAPGQTVALLGPNGAGKSTTIDMLLGLTAPDRGSVAIFGAPPERAVAAGAVGAMLQTGGVPGYTTPVELLSTVASMYPRPLPVDEVVAVTGLDGFARQRTDKLSGGQAQRLRAALALISNPDLLVLDEPTVAMDVEGRHTFWESVREFASRGRTVLFATHYLDEADRYADRIVLMRQGRVVADGPANEIRARAGQRTIRATVPGADLAVLGRLPGVASTEARGDTVTLTCPDSDAAIRALLADCPGARDIEITGAGLEAAFLALTGADHEQESR